ncbi:MAG TPA: zf-HC2 domain-containing protein, partial [Pyrinomonadaceae bacterium]|nr:zf-HC2 domain-containing protein [Pyrinomonadaceae bacterium]
MKCENIQFNLSIYADDILTKAERGTIDEHLAQCPLCRQKLSDFQMLRRDLRVLPRPELPADLLALTRNRVAGEIESAGRAPQSIFSDDVRRWLQMRLMPYGVATVLSLTFGFALLWSMLSANNSGQNIEIAKVQPYNRPPVLISNDSSAAVVNDFDLTAASYAAERFSVSGDSPSLNPKGALIALTKSLVRGNMKDDEVVVVADVFGSGLAR